MIGDLATKRVSGEGPEGYRTAIEFLASQAVSRIERLAALLDEPLLVTSGVNVRYLTGLSELECRRPRRSGRGRDPLHGLPLRAEGERARRRPLRADGARGDRRSRDAARRPDDRDRGARPHGREPRAASRGRRRDDLPHRDRRAAARDQGAGGDRDDARGGRDLRPRLRRARRGAVHRPDRGRARVARARALPRARLVGAGVRHDRRGGRERRQSARGRARRPDPGEHARHDRRRLPRRRLRLRLHAHVRDRRPPRRARRAPTRSVWRPSSPRSTPTVPAPAAAMWTQRRAT